MKVDNDTRAKIIEYVRGSQPSTVEGVVRILKEMNAQPDPAELLEREYTATAMRYLSIPRDEEGKRIRYSAGRSAGSGDSGSAYINIEECLDLPSIENIIKRGKAMRRFWTNYLHRAEKQRTKIVAGQISIFESDKLKQAE